jgi:HK97 family phage major capsid protein
MTPEELKKLIEEQTKAIAAYQARHEALLKGRVAESDFVAYQAKVQTRLDEIAAAMVKFQAPAQVLPGVDADAKSRLAVKAYEKFLRKMGDINALTPEERKTMTVADSTTGGYVAPVEFTNELIKGLVEYSPIRSVARVVTTSAKAKAWPKKTGSASASWVAETGTRSETTNPKLGLEEIPTHEMYALAKVSKQDLEDAQFDLMGFINEEFREQFGVAEGTAFVTGNSVGKPEGILTNSAVTGFTGVTTSAKIVADDLKQVFYALAEAYARNAYWAWKRSSTLAISLLKDNSSNQYLWQPGLQMGAPANVLGRPYIECPDMPAEAASAKAVVVGDFRKGYIIVDRIDIEMLIDPYTSKSTGCIEISGRKRVGGQVVLAEAFKVYTLKA